MLLASAYRIDPARAVLFVILSAVLAAWVYWHASRHGSRHPRAWAIATLVTWIAVLVYFVNYRMTRRRL